MPPPLWSDQLLAVARAFYAWLSRPRVRLTLTGVILLLTGGLVMTSSVWTLPLVIGGALMVVTAWIGRRLDGRFTVEWGQAGTQLEFRARIEAPAPAASGVPRLSAGAHPPGPGRPPESAAVIEAEAHTVEIDVAELEALIAAVEIAHADRASAVASAPAARDLRVTREGTGSSGAR